ncbi:MAG: hypothetical protein ACK55Z_13330, partial [bacterium]
PPAVGRLHRRLTAVLDHPRVRRPDDVRRPAVLPLQPVDDLARRGGRGEVVGTARGRHRLTPVRSVFPAIA